MGKSRIDVATEMLVRAEKMRNKGQRKEVLRAVRQLISWLAGKKDLPTPNAINTDDDDVAYCDLCFTGKNRGRLKQVDGIDLCKKCAPKSDVEAHYHKDEEAETERVQRELRRLQGDERVRDKYRCRASIKRSAELRRRRGES